MAANSKGGVILIVAFYSSLKKLCKNGYVYAKEYVPILHSSGAYPHLTSTDPSDLPFESGQSAVWSAKSQPEVSIQIRLDTKRGTQVADGSILSSSARVVRIPVSSVHLLSLRPRRWKWGCLLYTSPSPRD